MGNDRRPVKANRLAHEDDGEHAVVLQTDDGSQCHLEPRRNFVLRQQVFVLLAALRCQMDCFHLAQHCATPIIDSTGYAVKRARRVSPNVCRGKTRLVKRR
jgi:hypothetical protein